ncbi:MAG: ABC transporter substrate-binding protein [Anaerolineae bacterium]|nr:ABC transporter substrate-binding protein [Anaerolineae bacterium]MDW8171127.1 ABC transporter substrate-binding protein [Anaerolineae bacterium]
MANRTFRLLPLAASALLLLGVAQAQGAVTIDFYFPEATANNAQAIFEEYAAKFNEKFPNITINVAYQGSYTDNRVKIQTELAAGAGPDVAVMLTTDLFSFIEADTIVPAQQFIDQMEDGEAFVANFFPAFLANSLDEEGTVWAIPFQRSTPVLYYNADLLEAAGLSVPRNQDELRAVAKALTTPERHGLWLPSEGFPIWLFSAAAIANGQNLSSTDPCEVTFATDAAQAALDYWLSLPAEGVMPAGLLSWGDAPQLFIDGKAAMIAHTTGSLTRILNNAPFKVGVAFLPFGPADENGEGYGAPTGGGNLYMFKNSSPEEQAAAWEWIKFLASDEIQADWGARTGYVAATLGAWETEPLASLVKEKPQYAVARDQLAHADKEFSAFRTIDLQGIINTALSDIISGGAPNDGTRLKVAQEQIDGLLAEFCQ